MPTTTLQRISPFLWFDDNAEDAVAFYTSVFENSRVLAVTRYPEAGREQHQRPPGSVMTIDFELAGQRFIALNGGPQFKFTEAVSFSVGCQTQAEIDRYWTKLLAGGGAEVQCGWLRDRFGLSWQVVPANFPELVKDPAKCGRVMQSLMGMVKLDMGELKAAADGR